MSQPRIWNRALSAVAILTLMAHPLAAEVYDKVPTEAGLWIRAVVLAGASVVSWRVRRWLGWLFVPVVVVFVIGTVGLVTDPYVGPAILAELGTRYVVSAWLSAGLVAVACAGGVWHGRARARVRNGVA